MGLYVSEGSASAVHTLVTRLDWDQSTLTHEPQSLGQAAHMWTRTSLRPSDVDVAELYDGFTINCLSWIEALGFCGIGEAKDFLAGGTNIARDFKYIDSHTITCRTPKANAGVVDVRVERNTDFDILPGGFSYFDPRSVSGGLSGGPMVGTLNVTVLSGDQNDYTAPVAGANVIIGTDPTTPFQGVTDYRGQITFSDDTLVKAELVTVFKDFWQSASVTNVNAENLTVFLSRTGGGEPSSGQMMWPSSGSLTRTLRPSGATSTASSPCSAIGSSAPVSIC